MRYLILILLFPFALSSQVVDFTLTDGSSLGINLGEIKFVIDGDGEYTVRYEDALKTAVVTGDAATFYASYCIDFGQFVTTGSDTIIINKDFVSRVYDLGASGSRIDTRRLRLSFLTASSYSTIITALGEGCILPWPENNTYHASLGGDDATAVKNDPSRPWGSSAVFNEDPSFGSTFDFFPGTYTVGDAGSGASWGEHDGVVNRDFIPTDIARVHLRPGVIWRNEAFSTTEGYGIINDNIGANVVDYEIYGPDAEFSLAYDGEGRFMAPFNASSRVKFNIGKVTMDAPTPTSLFYSKAQFGFANVETIGTIGKADMYGEQDFLWISFPDDAYHWLDVKKHFIRHDSINTGDRVGYWPYGSNIAGDVDRHTFYLRSKNIVVDHTELTGFVATTTVPANQIGRIYNTSGNRGRFNDSYHYMEFDRVRFINQLASNDVIATTGAGGLYTESYNGNNEYFHVIPNWLDQSHLKLKVGDGDFSLAGMFMYFQEGTYRNNTTVDVDLGTIIGKETLISMDPTLETGTVINITCDRCEVTDGVVLGFDGSIDATSTLVISGTFITNGVGDPAIVLSNAGAGTIILKDVTVINDGTVAAIQADVAQTVIVSGAYDGNTVILDTDITFTKNEY